MIFVPTQKLSGINSNVDIKAKLTPSAGQVESDAVTVLRANTCEFMSFGYSIPIYSHFKTYFTAVKRLFHADAHANHVESFPAASRWMITCLAAVGCFHDLFFYFFILFLITFIQSTINNQKYLQTLRHLHYLQYNI